MSQSAVKNLNAQDVVEPQANAEFLIIEHLDLWTSAITSRSTTGRGSNKKIELYGIKKLRDLILELAVRGKLVPQDPNNESAKDLIKRIEDEKSKLVKGGKFKKSKKIPPISEGEEPFEIPFGWEWIRLSDVYDVRDGTHDSPKYTSDGIPLITSKNLSSGTLDFSDVKNISKVDHIKISERSKVERSDILFAMIGSIGNPVIVDTDREFSIKNVALFKYYSEALSCPEFLLQYLKYAEAVFKAEASGAVQSFVSLGKIRSFPFALPPLEEQHRVVAKIEELMALCDQLENQTEQSLDAHATLADTLLDALTQAQRADELAENWQRLEQNWDLLFPASIAGERAIDKLKQTILQLAVMGKLVPQDPNDEPASELLKRIVSEKEQMIKEQKIKKQKPLPPMGNDDKPFDLPMGWEWCRLEDVCEIQSGITKGRKLVERETVLVPYLRVANVQRSALNLDEIKEVEIPVEEKEKYRVSNSDLLITEGGDWDKVGRTAIWRNELPYVAHQNHVFKATSLLPDGAELWLEKYLNSPFSREYFASSSKQTTNLASINKTQLRGCVVAIPPMSEQNQIVTKMNRLFELCDQLVKCIKVGQENQLKFTQSVIEKSVNKITGGVGRMDLKGGGNG